MLVTFVRAGDDLASLREGCEEVGERRDDLMFLWLVETPFGDPAEELRAVLTGARIPIFVATTRSDDYFRLPGFDRGRVSVLIDDGMRIRMVIPPAVPLSVLGIRIAESIAGRRSS